LLEAGANLAHRIVVVPAMQATPGARAAASANRRLDRLERQRRSERRLPQEPTSGAHVKPRPCQAA
jgi:hypothetical protein